MPPKRKSQSASDPTDATLSRMGARDGARNGPAQELAARVVAGDRSAISQALNQVDDNRPQHREQALALLDALEKARRITAETLASNGGPQEGAEADNTDNTDKADEADSPNEGNAALRRGARIGVTGAPGSGKSTLLDALVVGHRERGRSVGVLAVDPSSQRTGGALLGDRMRLGSAARDAGVFLRSLAARDQLGGLSEVTGPSLDVLASALDAVFVETVGVGQSEAQVIDVVDTLVFVAQPAAGDLIQFMKAGILEWPDLFFVNKSDLGTLASRTASELQSGIDLGSRRDADYEPVVLSGSARDGEGIDALIDAIDAHQEYLATSQQGAIRRRAGRIARIRSALGTRYGRFGLGLLSGPDAIEQCVDGATDQSVDRLTDELGKQIEEAMKHGDR